MRARAAAADSHTVWSGLSRWPVVTPGMSPWRASGEGSGPLPRVAGSGNAASGHGASSAPRLSATFRPFAKDTSACAP